MNETNKEIRSFRILYVDSVQFKCQTRLLHSSEAEILTQTITDLDNVKLSQTLNELFPLVTRLFTTNKFT